MPRTALPISFPVVCGNGRTHPRGRTQAQSRTIHSGAGGLPRALVDGSARFLTLAGGAGTCGATAARRFDTFTQVTLQLSSRGAVGCGLLRRSCFAASPRARCARTDMHPGAGSANVRCTGDVCGCHVWRARLACAGGLPSPSPRGSGGRVTNRVGWVGAVLFIHNQSYWPGARMNSYSW